MVFQYGLATERFQKIFAKDDALITLEVSRDKATILVSQSAHPLRRNEHALIILNSQKDSYRNCWFITDFLGGQNLNSASFFGISSESSSSTTMGPMRFFPRAGAAGQRWADASRVVAAVAAVGVEAWFRWENLKWKTWFLPQDLKLSCRFSNQSKSQMDGSLRMPQKDTKRGFHGISWNWVAETIGFVLGMTNFIHFGAYKKIPFQDPDIFLLKPMIDCCKSCFPLINPELVLSGIGRKRCTCFDIELYIAFTNSDFSIAVEHQHRIAACFAGVSGSCIPSNI